MKIALLTSWLSRRMGGLFSLVPPLGRALLAEGVTEVEVWGLEDGGLEQDREAWMGLQVRAFPTVGIEAFGYAPAMASALDAAAVDLVHTIGLWMYPSVVARRWSDRSGRPYIVSPHGMLYPWALRNSRWRKRVAALLYENAHLQHAACLHATSETEAQHLRRYGLQQPIAVVPNCLNLPPPGARQRSPPGDGRRTALFLSRLHPVKGLPFLIQAWKRVQDRHPEWRLVVAGPDEKNHAGELRQLMADVDVHRVEFHGEAYGEEKNKLYASADVFVLPSHSENFGLVVPEALAWGVPVITTTSAPWRGLSTHGCGWWIDLSVDNLASSLEEAMSLPDRHRREMGARGQAWIERDFSSSSVAQQMRGVYAWVLGGGPPPNCVLVR